MRHSKNKVTLDRKSAPRKALLRGLVESLILAEKIKTTLAKAKAIRPIVEKLITNARKGTLASRRHAIQYLYTQKAVKQLMDKTAPRFKERKGGYTRIIKLGARPGDGAEEAIIEFVD